MFTLALGSTPLFLTMKKHNGFWKLTCVTLKMKTFVIGIVATYRKWDLINFKLLTLSNATQIAATYSICQYLYCRDCGCTCFWTQQNILQLPCRIRTAPVRKRSSNDHLKQQKVHGSRVWHTLSLSKAQSQALNLQQTILLSMQSYW